MRIGSRDLEIFDALADTLLPSLDGPGPAWTSRGGDLGLSERLPIIFERLPHDQDRKDLKLFLRLLDSRVGGLSLYGKPKAFVELSTDERGSAVRAMESHRIGLIRSGIKALKTLVGFFWVSREGPGADPDSWSAMAYPGPDGPPPKVEKTLPLVRVRGDTEMSCDVVIVGSGAGGGTAAGVLASAGLDVVVLEAAEYRNESDFTHLEADAYRDMYLDKALSSTADGGIAILSGATLGGGTVVNYTTSFATPLHVRKEWDQIAGFDEVFTGEQFQESLDSVAERLSVNSDHGWPSNRATLLEKGARELGWHVGEMPRNAVGCTEKDCGYCTLGCRIGAKQSMLSTYLADATEAGARIVTGAQVEAVYSESGRARGVMAVVGESVLNVRAHAVVLAAGALNTPAIMLRSRLGGPAVGNYLRLHPVTAVWSRFDERVDPWSGILQTRYVDEFADLDGAGYGFKFETAPVHPLFPAGFLGWEDGASFKRDILGMANVSVAGILLRDRDHGRVTIRRDGSPVWKYAISKYDQAHMREGVRRATEISIAAGATEVVSSTIRPVRWRPGRSLDEFMAGVDEIGYGSNRMGYFTFHQMGSARMGTDPASSVVGPDNQAHGLLGLYVMDGSCFPSPSGVNPMLSIASIAHRGATLLAERIA